MRYDNKWFNVIITTKKRFFGLLYSWVFIGFLGLVTLFLSLYITLIQIPERAAVKRQMEKIEYQTDINREVTKLSRKYHENSVNICQTYYDSLFKEYGVTVDTDVESYDDDYVDIITANIYFDEYFVGNDFSKPETLDDEITMFLSTFKDILSDNEELLNLMQERESLYVTITNLSNKLQ